MRFISQEMRTYFMNIWNELQVKKKIFECECAFLMIPLYLGVCLSLYRNLFNFEISQQTDNSFFSTRDLWFVHVYELKSIFTWILNICFQILRVTKYTPIVRSTIRKRSIQNSSKLIPKIITISFCSNQFVDISTNNIGLRKW